MLLSEMYVKPLATSSRVWVILLLTFVEIPLLKVVQNPIAVNPDTKLKQICMEKNWKIKDLP